MSSESSGLHVGDPWQFRFGKQHLPGAILLAVVLLSLGIGAGGVVLTEGMPVVLVLLAALGLGGRPAIWQPHAYRTTGQQLLISVAIGLGIVVLLTMALGLAGYLDRVTAWVVVGVGLGKALFDGWRGAGSREQGTGNREQKDRLETGPTKKDRLQTGPTVPAVIAIRCALYLLLAPPLIVALFGATLPPGILWPGEAGAYDALEYHLQAPREYFEAGHIHFLRHNVYAQFPQQVETLYLLLMHLRGGPIEGAIASQLMHAALGVLAVLAIGAWLPAGWPRLLGVLFAGSTPWVGYLAPLAYVECGMLFFGAVAAGIVIEQVRRGTDAAPRAMLWAGWCAGMAAGCKYTAIVLIAIGVWMFLLIAARTTVQRRVGLLANFAVGAALLFAPWVIRNTALSGNPVYPFAYEVFGGKAWSTEQALQWRGGHATKPGESRIAIAARELFGSPDAAGRFAPSLFGIGFVALSAAAMLLARDRMALALAVWCGLILVVWVSATQVPGRFAVPLVIPAALAVGLAFDRLREKWQQAALGIAVATVAGAGAAQLTGEFSNVARTWHERNVPLAMLAGQTALMRTIEPIAATVPSDASVWLVGDAAVFYVDRRVRYTVAFSRDPWLVAVEGERLGPRDAVDLLRKHNATHVVFNPSEIERLRRTYGFAAVVTREWLAELVDAGLRPIPAKAEGDPRLYFEVPRE
ncbi:MAG: hypothetical protein ACKVS9_15920 [Phycisphaerae bacterium]